MEFQNDDRGRPIKQEMEIVDPIDQLAMSLKWDEDYSDDYKRRVLVEAVDSRLYPRKQ